MFYFHTHGRRFLVTRSQFRPRARAWEATDTKTMRVVAHAARHSDIHAAIIAQCEQDERINAMIAARIAADAQG